MADQTTSSIVIDAPPSQVMDVIADFPAYPTWAKGVTTADVVSEFPDGRAEKVFFKLDVSPIKDEYTLVYVWSGDEQVTWSLDSGKMLKALDGAYVLTDLGDGSTIEGEPMRKLSYVLAAMEEALRHDLDAVGQPVDHMEDRLLPPRHVPARSHDPRGGHDEQFFLVAR